MNKYIKIIIFLTSVISVVAINGMASENIYNASTIIDNETDNEDEYIDLSIEGIDPNIEESKLIEDNDDEFIEDHIEKVYTNKKKDRPFPIVEIIIIVVVVYMIYILRKTHKR